MLNYNHTDTFESVDRQLQVYNLANALHHVDAFYKMTRLKIW